MKRALAYILLIVALFLGSALLILDFPSWFSPKRSESEIILHSNYNDIARDMVVDSQGNVIIVGGRMDLLDPPDLWTCKFHAVKISSLAQVIWTKTWNVSSSDMLVGVDVDSLDNIVVTGISGFNEANSTGHVMKLNPSGDMLWQETLAGITYDWYWWPNSYNIFGVEIDLATDNLYVVGCLNEGCRRTLVAGLNASGSEQWRTEWAGPANSNGTDAISFWLSSQEGIVVSGRVYGGDDPYDPFVGSYIAAFDLSGNLQWNRTGRFLNGLELGVDEFIATRDSWRGNNRVSRYTYDFEELSSFDLLVGDYYHIEIQGFIRNGTENIIGYGEVESLSAGSAVGRYTPLFEGPQPPQTLVFSCNSSGELEWFDFLVIGRISEPCGFKFDKDNRLIIAGHTSAWSFTENSFFVVFGFRLTPFFLPYEQLLLGFIPIFNILMVALAREAESMRQKGLSAAGLRSSRLTTFNVIKYLALAELAIFLAMQATLATGGGGGPPPMLVYLPLWVTCAFWSFLLGLLTLGFIFLIVRYRKRQGKTAG